MVCQQCVECGAAERLEAHHIISVAECPSAAFLRMNGVTLCRKCHQETDSWGGFKKSQVSQIGETRYIIKVIPHKYQEYSTCGNWQFTEDGIGIIFVSDVGNADYEFLVAFHELIEMTLCRKRGISEPEIMAFDEAFEAKREPGNNDEPGDCKDAPYYREHQFATGMERLMCAEIGADWNDYDNTLISLFDE